MTRRPGTFALLTERFAACDEAIARLNREKAAILKQADASGFARWSLRRHAQLLRRDNADRRFEQAVARAMGARR